MRIACIVAVAVALAAIGAGSGTAAPILVIIQTEFGDFDSETVEGTPLPDGTFTASGSSTGFASTFAATWSTTFDIDPAFMSFLASFTITNTSAVGQDFTVSVTLPVAPFIADGRLLQGYYGEISYGDATGPDSSGDVAIKSGTGSMLGAFLDSRLGAFGFLGIGEFDATQSGAPGVSGTIPRQSFSYQVADPTSPNPPVNSSITQRARFHLSAHDHASFPIQFQVVPETGASLLVGLGLAGIAAARRAPGPSSPHIRMLKLMKKPWWS
jgi:hypothetical protein